MKICPTCAKEWPEEKYGRSYYCRECMAERARVRRAKIVPTDGQVAKRKASLIKKDAMDRGLPTYFTGIPCSKGHVAERLTTTGDCIVCLKIRQAKWCADNAETINAKSRKWYAEHVEHAAVTRARWREENYEKFRADVAEYKATHKEQLKVAADLWIENNPDKVRATRTKYLDNNHERVLLSASEWRKRNRDKVNAKKKRREAAKSRAVPSWADLSAIKAIYKEASRLTEMTGIQHHVDHIVPLKSPWVCGLHCEANLQILPYYENQSKSNRYWPDMPDLAGEKLRQAA